MPPPVLVSLQPGPAPLAFQGVSSEGALKKASSFPCSNNAVFLHTPTHMQQKGKCVFLTQIGETTSTLIWHSEEAYCGAIFGHVCFIFP